MATALYMDVHAPGPITQQLRLHGVDVLTAQEDQHDTASDSTLLRRAGDLNRLLFTQDIRFRRLAETWQERGQEFSGLLFGAQLGATIGQYVEDLKLIALASDAAEWKNIVQFLPFKREG